jgi:hypothetical protein
MNQTDVIEKSGGAPVSLVVIITVWTEYLDLNTNMTINTAVLGAAELVDA